MKTLLATQSAVVILLVVGYTGLALFSLWKWNAEISSALITGFALMAQTIVRGFFDLHTNGNGHTQENKDNAQLAH